MQNSFNFPSDGAAGMLIIQVEKEIYTTEVGNKYRGIRDSESISPPVTSEIAVNYGAQWRVFPSSLAFAAAY